MGWQISGTSCLVGTDYFLIELRLSQSFKPNIAAGVGAGLSRYSIIGSELDFMNTVVAQAVYDAIAINKTRFDLDAGIYTDSAYDFFDLSALQIVSSRLAFSDNTVTRLQGKTVPHLLLKSGYRFLPSEHVHMIPSLMLKHVQPLPVQVEANINMQYRDFLWAGCSHQLADSLGIMAGIHRFNLASLSLFIRSHHFCASGTQHGHAQGDTQLYAGQQG